MWESKIVSTYTDSDSSAYTHKVLIKMFNLKKKYPSRDTVPLKQSMLRSNKISVVDLINADVDHILSSRFPGLSDGAPVSPTSLTELPFPLPLWLSSRFPGLSDWAPVSPASLIDLQFPRPLWLISRFFGLSDWAPVSPASLTELPFPRPLWLSSRFPGLSNWAPVSPASLTELPLSRANLREHRHRPRHGGRRQRLQESSIFSFKVFIEPYPLIYIHIKYRKPHVFMFSPLPNKCM